MGIPAVDSHKLRGALGQFPTGVCIVTATVTGEQIGMTISSFNTLSLQPPLVLFSIARRAMSLPLWEKAKGYAVNVLSEKQRDLSNRFAKSLGRKWQGITFGQGLAGAPIFPGVAAAFECAPYAIHDGGDHLLFVAEVKRFRTDSDRLPLVFSQGRYAALKPTGNAAPPWPLDIHY